MSRSYTKALQHNHNGESSITSLNLKKPFSTSSIEDDRSHTNLLPCLCVSSIATYTVTPQPFPPTHPLLGLPLQTRSCRVRQQQRAPTSSTWRSTPTTASASWPTRALVMVCPRPQCSAVRCRMVGRKRYCFLLSALYFVEDKAKHMENKREIYGETIYDNYSTIVRSS